MKIHSTAIIDKGAELDGSVSVGPYVVIENGVKIGADTEILPHTVISGTTIIGERNRIGPFSTIGAPPQDIKYSGEDTRLVIGDDNQIREYVSMHRGTVSGHKVTTVGSNNLFMAYVHIAHDCIICDDIIMANAATLGGHVEVEDHVTLGGLVAVQQFIRIGAHSFIGGLSGINQDVPPFVILAGTRAGMRVTRINSIGLKRYGVDEATIQGLHKAFRIIFRTKGLLLQDALDKAIAENPDNELVEKLVAFFKTSNRSVVRNAGNE
ncbi:MAG: acyl-ACP--UDP-N-acetylglucosamine O-acyltransferase [Thermodesulfobacteriota bacterium]|nr:acyl-ACP--UDP-N-acetylglucosamine O-acyltransferase [Thermodesulfobacteriota bacterium]